MRVSTIAVLTLRIWRVMGVGRLLERLLGRRTRWESWGRGEFCGGKDGVDGERRSTTTTINNNVVANDEDDDAKGLFSIRMAASKERRSDTKSGFFTKALYPDAYILGNAEARGG